MKKYFGILIAISFVAILTGLSSCESFKPVEVGNPTNFKVHSVETDKITASIFLPIKNPNLLSIKIKEINAIAFINDKKTGKVTNSEVLKIPGNSDKTQQLKFEINFSDIASSGLSVFSILKEGKVDLKLKGTITAKSLFTKRKINFTKERTIRLNE
jgi:LEA14-like dessication related protein